MIKALKHQPVGFKQLAEHIKMNSGTKQWVAKQRNKLLQLLLKGTIQPDEESEEFEGRLRAQTRDIILEFNVLENKLFDMLENYSIPKLAKYLEVYHAENLTSFDSMQEFIKNKSSFYDYEILKYIIGVAGTEGDKECLQQYEKQFEAYAWDRFQSTSTSPATPDSQSVSKICIKLDSEYDELQCHPDKLMQFHSW